MSESNYKPDGTGVVMGDRRPMPDRGTKTGMTGHNPHLDGASLGLDSTNSMGSFSSETRSTPMAEDRARDQNVKGGA